MIGCVFSFSEGNGLIVFAGAGIDMIDCSDGVKECLILRVFDSFFGFVLIIFLDLIWIVFF